MLDIRRIALLKLRHTAKEGEKIKISTFNGNFHEFLQKWVKKVYSFSYQNISAVIILSVLIFVRKFKQDFIIPVILY